MNNFVYNIPTKVYFGENQLHNLGTELKKFGTKVLMTYGGGSIKRIGLYDKVMKEVKNAGLELFELGGIEPNPKISSVRDGVRICKENNIDVLLAVGGGSTIDCTKFIAAGAKVEHDAWDFMDLSKRSKINEALPIVDILTLSATGSEMDSGGVISNPETNDKIGRLDENLFPKVSFLDPTNTFTVSKYQTACGSADMISHILEVYFNMNEDMEMLDSFMEGMLRTIIKYTPIAIAEPENYKARAELMWTSSWAINGFINGGKRLAWSCHPMEHELSAYYDITHGLGLAILTPRWMEYCLSEKTVSKYVQFATNVFGIDANQEPMAIARQGIEALASFLFDTLGLKRTLQEVGIDESKFAIMAEKAVHGDTLQGFVPLKKEDVENIYRMCR
ncbi:MAG: iron-containing alcohol dehydrogenase [Bacteroidales bacterium]|nr:iron-containing alcohol dehydrogenase [Bacteroidales bacterium]